MITTALLSYLDVAVRSRMYPRTIEKSSKFDYNNCYARKFYQNQRSESPHLKNINLDIPKNKLVVSTGISGSGKSSLAFGTLYAQGQRRYVESLSDYARQLFL